jgi:hypothetical protein
VAWFYEAIGNSKFTYEAKPRSSGKVFEALKH